MLKKVAYLMALSLLILSQSSILTVLLSFQVTRASFNDVKIKGVVLKRYVVFPLDYPYIRCQGKSDFT